MLGPRFGVVLWLLAGIAFLGAGLFTEGSQPLWFAVATISFAVSILTARRSRPPTP
jgi:hypothetical membrane protein